MRNLILSAALTLALVLTAAGCGGEDTAAHRNDGENNSVVLQNEARGGPKAETGILSEGRYRADENGRVEDHGEHTDDEGTGTDLGQDLMKAEEDMLQDTKDALDDLGKAAENGMTNSAADNGPGEGKDPEINAGNSSNPSVN